MCEMREPGKPRSGPEPEPFDVEAERDALGVEVAYTTKQVARIFGISETTVRKAIGAGTLEAVRPPAARGWRITRAACRDWMRREGICIVLS